MYAGQIKTDFINDSNFTESRPGSSVDAIETIDTRLQLTPSNDPRESRLLGKLQNRVSPIMSFAQNQNNNVNGLRTDIIKLSQQVP